jgi:carboxymethylenebutenolidase
LGIFATEDNWINKKVVGDYEKAMKEADKNFENHWFKAEHAFANPSSNRFNKKEAQKANELAFDYLQSVFK